MKRTAIARRTPLKRGGPLQRRTPIRAVAPKRGGMIASEILELKRLHRRAVMMTYAVRLEIGEVKNERGSGVKYWGRCLWCSLARWLQCAHIENVGTYPSMRFDVDNAVPLCTGCHLYRWHKNPREAEAWIVTVIGQEKRDELAARAIAAGNGWPHFGVARLELERTIKSLKAA